MLGAGATDRGRRDLEGLADLRAVQAPAKAFARPAQRRYLERCFNIASNRPAGEKG